MRAAAILLALATAAGAGENLLPREGSGWLGFSVGSRVKLKQTVVAARGAPSVSITEMKLLEASETTITYAYESKTALGVDNRSAKQSVPARGEANTGEKVVKNESRKEEVTAGGKTYACTRRTLTITGPDGKRVVTNWEASDPQVRVKRTETQYDSAGKQTQSFSMLLKSLDETRKVSGKEVRCVEYATLRIAGDIEQKGTALLSRDVPGGTVRMEFDQLKDGVKLATVRFEVISFKAKIGSQ